MEGKNDRTTDCRCAWRRVPEVQTLGSDCTNTRDVYRLKRSPAKPLTSRVRALPCDEQWIAHAPIRIRRRAAPRAKAKAECRMPNAECRMPITAYRVRWGPGAQRNIGPPIELELIVVGAKGPRLTRGQNAQRASPCSVRPGNRNRRGPTESVAACPSPFLRGRQSLFQSRSGLSSSRNGPSLNEESRRSKQTMYALIRQPR